MRKKIIISNQKELEKLIRLISRGGAGKFHVVADFDRTLTKACVDGKYMPSLISILRDGNYLTPDYADKAHNLYNKYHLIELDPEIPLEQKKKAMHEWWTVHFDLLIKSGLNKKDLEKVTEQGQVRLRNGFKEFINILKIHDIPLVIISSSGLGSDAISMYLKKHKELHDNIYIISNLYEWDRYGNAIAIKQPIIHVMNKDETALQGHPVFNIIKNRKNVLLLGDNLSDINMVNGFHYDYLIKIGFLNKNIEENLEQYKRNYHVVIPDASSMLYVNKLLKEIIV